MFLLYQNVREAVLDQTKGLSGFSRASGESTGRNVQKFSSRMILPLICDPCFSQQIASEAFGARGCIRLSLMPLMGLSSVNLSNPFLNIFESAPEHPAAMGFALYFCIVWKSTLFAHFKSMVWLLYWIFFLSLNQHRLLWLPDLCHAINDFINLSSLLSGSFSGWEFFLLSLYIKSVPKLWSFLLSLSSSFQLRQISPVFTCIFLLYPLP